MAHEAHLSLAIRSSAFGSPANASRRLRELEHAVEAAGLGGGIPSSEIRAQLLGDAALSAEMRARLLSSHLAATPHSEMRSRLLSSDHLSSGDPSSGDLSVGNLSARNLSVGFSQLVSAVHLVLTIRASTGGVEALAEKLAWLVAHRPVLERLLQGEPKPKPKPESKAKPKP